MDLYRRIAAIRTEEDASDLVDEMLDRYGEVRGVSTESARNDKGEP